MKFSGATGGAHSAKQPRGGKSKRQPRAMAASRSQPVVLCPVRKAELRSCSSYFFDRLNFMPFLNHTSALKRAFCRKNQDFFKNSSKSIIFLKKILLFLVFAKIQHYICNIHRRKESNIKNRLRTTQWQPTQISNLLIPKQHEQVFFKCSTRRAP